jgi:hypothetical protein
VALDELAGDHVPLDLVGSLAHDHQRRVPEVPLDVELGGVPIAAVDASTTSASIPSTPLESTP